MTIGFVNKVIPFSSVDGPGNRMAVFLQGCNFNCLYCHNPETIAQCKNCRECISTCPSLALSYENKKVVWNEQVCSQCDTCLITCKQSSTPKTKEMNVEDIMREMRPIQWFLSGVTVSGGECTLQKDFLIELGAEVKEAGLTFFVDTNGSTDFEAEQTLCDSFDMAMLDVKSVDPEEHFRLTNYSNETVLKNLHYLASRKKLYEVRTVIIPGALDNEQNVREISSIIAQYSSSIRYKLIKYRPFGVRKHLLQADTPTQEMMTRVKEIAEKSGCRHVIIV